jgi:hypothetical protein
MMSRLHEAIRETSQVGRLPAQSYLPRVNVYLPEIRSSLASNLTSNFRQVDVYMMSRVAQSV